METFIFSAIIAGAFLMIVNIIRFFRFIRSTSDVLSSGRRRDKAWAYTAFILLVFSCLVIL